MQLRAAAKEAAKEAENYAGLKRRRLTVLAEMLIATANSLPKEVDG
jgi:hypothetical protein